MNRNFSIGLLALVLAGSMAYPVKADVRSDERSLVKFEGMLGRVAGIFGGRAAREGVKTSVAVKGSRKATIGDDTGQIIDLKEEKIYDLDLKKKTYKVMTFAEIRRQMEEAQRRAAEDLKKAQAEAKASPQPQRGSSPPANSDGKQMEMDFDLKETGQKRSVNGFDAKQYLMTITMREKGKKLEESGGMVLTSDIWMTPSIPAMKEVADFDLRYAKALAGPMISGASAQEMASAMAMYPMMKDALARMRTEGVKMDGTPVQTTTTMDAVQSAEQQAADQKQQQQPPQQGSGSGAQGVGGLLGGLGRRIGRGNNNDQNQNQNRPATPGRVTIMTMTNEVLKVTTSVSDSDIALPAGFKESK
jgi:hypothetical protein